MNKTYDVAVIGGGHNGLVCACYHVKAGLFFSGDKQIAENRAVEFLR